MAIDLDATMPAEPASRPAGPASDPRGVDVTATAAGSVRARRVAAEGGIQPGVRLAHFRVEKKLGEGGMGQVWLATDLALDRPVALKLLPAEVAADPDRRDRLIREARAQARLVHPNVCHIYFIGEDDGRLFFAMEYVDGETLAQRLERGPLPPDQAIELARMAALGLRAAAQAGFTHRDIKPSNLMIDRHGVLKVMDFGLVASSPDRDTVDGAAPAAASALVGTPLYMAPEQGRGEAVDHRADIYALGATLHHMIAGAPPFLGDTAAELLSRHETSARPRLTVAAPARRRATLVDEVVAQMMAKRAADRPASYDELLDALDRASVARTRPAGLWPRAMAALVDIILTAIAAVPFGMVTPAVDNDVWMFAIGMVLMPVLVARRGTTPGHALFDLEVVRHRGPGRVPLFAATTRMVVQYGGIVLGFGLSDLGGQLALDWVHWAGIALAIAGFGFLAAESLRAAARSVDKRTLWDRAGGTRVCYRRRAPGGA